MDTRYNLSIDIGASSIKYLYGSNFFGKIRIKEFGALKLPRGSFKHGYIIDINVIEALIKGLIDTKKIKPRSISFVLHSKDIISRNLYLPVMEYRELRNIISFEMNQFTNGNINDYYLSYGVIEKHNGNYKILAVIIPKKLVDAYILLSKELNIKLRYIDTASQCLLRIFKEMTTNITILDLGHESIRMSIFDNKRLYLDKEFNFNLKEEDSDREKKVCCDKAEDEQYNVEFQNCLRQLKHLVECYSAYKAGEDSNIVHFIGGGSYNERYREIATEFFREDPLYKDIIIKKLHKLDDKFKENIKLYINCLGLFLRRE